MHRRHWAVLADMLAQPTASFREAAVAAAIRRWAAAEGFPVTEDGNGNLLVQYRRGRGRRPHWFFTAHMDHPAFVVTRRRGRTVWADFRGGVLHEYFAGAAVVFDTAGGPVRAVVDEAVRKPKVGWWSVRLTCMKAPSKLPAGTVGMWDVPVVQRRGTRIHGRACDDLAGVAAVCCALSDLAARPVDATVTGLFTRAEEVGFIGAVAACHDGTIPKNGLVVAIETSKAQPAARLGQGVVVRVGDRTWTFDATLTAHVSDVAEKLAANEKSFRFTRQLMPGGTCESTAFCVYGLQATGLCLPLGNYHNMGPRNGVAPEVIDERDFESLVELLVALPTVRNEPAETRSALHARLEDRLQRRGPYLTTKAGQARPAAIEGSRR